MAYYLVRAKPKDNLDELRARLDERTIAALNPFGSEMQQALERARITEDGTATWEEQCFCTPPLKQEREVLTRYFDDITVNRIQQGDGWQQISDLSSLWD